jgi:hypothetical protein
LKMRRLRLEATGMDVGVNTTERRARPFHQPLVCFTEYISPGLCHGKPYSVETLNSIKFVKISG